MNSQYENEMTEARLNSTLSDNEINLMTQYCTRGSAVVAQELLPWMLPYLCDKNSSSVREGVTAAICGYEWSRAKRDYDAFDKTNPPTIVPVEIKPKLFNGVKQNAGGANFSDLQLARVDKMLNDGVSMVISLFAYNRLIYVIEFPFSVIYERIYEQVKEKIEAGNRYCRNSQFGYKDYIDSDDLVVRYLDKDRMLAYNCTNRPFTKALLARV